VRTAGRWSWKSKSAKKCVTTYLPNEPALKIDDAETFALNDALGTAPPRGGGGTSRGVDERGGGEEARGVTRSSAASGADLGGSSERSGEKLEGRSGEGFHENGNRS